MKEERIKVLMIEPGKAPKVSWLTNELTALQEAVSIGADYQGLIEVVGLDEKTCILCNEEGKLIGLEPNRRFGSDILCGVFYIVGQSDEGEFCSLDDYTMECYAQLFHEIERFTEGEVDKTIIARFFRL